MARIYGVRLAEIYAAGRGYNGFVRWRRRSREGVLKLAVAVRPYRHRIEGPRPVGREPCKEPGTNAAAESRRIAKKGFVRRSKAIWPARTSVAPRERNARAARRRARGQRALRGLGLLSPES